mmetsp:Transcript_26823/g.61856  ORF Transcript_26823/g.61856 Transcript_26823/m.61856 type:complete len:214 (-) Transcript_26823:726-1367(-)
MVPTTDRTTAGLSTYLPRTVCPTAMMRYSGPFKRTAMCGFLMVRLANKPNPCSHTAGLEVCWRTAPKHRNATSDSTASRSLMSSENPNARMSDKHARTTLSSLSVREVSTLVSNPASTINSLILSSLHAIDRKSSIACSRRRGSGLSELSKASALSAAALMVGKTFSLMALSRFSTAAGTQDGCLGSSSLIKQFTDCSIAVCTGVEEGKDLNA